MQLTETGTKTSVDRVYDAVKDMAVAYRLKPGERLNEVALAKALGASRTPLREALNRLVAERLLDFRPGRGFFCRGLDPRELFDLYELRRIIEVEAARLACERGSSEEIAALAADETYYDWRLFGEPIQHLVAIDERFHLAIAALAGNRELGRDLARLNDRIRFMRWLDMDRRIEGTKSEHRAIARAIVARNADAAARAMSSHIERRQDQINAVVREGFSAIYMSDLDDEGTG